MSRESLQKWLLSDPHFLTSFNSLEIKSVRAQFPKLRTYISQFEMNTNWPYLLFCASILAPSEIAAAEEKALRIAQTALMDPSTLAPERDAALIILDALSNRRAIQLAEDRQRVSKGLNSRLGAIQSIDWLRRSLESRIEIGEQGFFYANRFQQRFWSAAKNSDWLSVSAPTSAGKSFILGQFLVDQISSREFTRVVYLAPTRALIQQVERDLRAMLRDRKIDGVEVRSIPEKNRVERADQEIFVFTQERLHYYLLTSGGSGIDALIVDEAHKLGDDSRGILLQDVIERVGRANPRAKVIFTAPLAENPEALLFDAPDGTSSMPLKSDEPTVNQNLLWLQPDYENPKVWELSLRRSDKSIPLGTFETATRLVTIKSRIASLAILSDTGDGGVLIYANGAARAEEFAEEIASRLPETTPSKSVQRLDELCRTTIHKEFALRKVLKKGVAFHYGNMPLLLRTAIEDLFRDGHIRFLVCTSTLVEGVNLPCRNIVVHAPKKGGNKPMTKADFWNLAGRAGRWGREFQGNVICIDTQDAETWGDTLPRIRSRYVIERTADRILNEEMPLVEYLTAGSPSYHADQNQDLETAVSYLAAIHNDFGSITKAPWSGRISAEKLRGIDEVLHTALDTVDLPIEWIRRHAGISPFAMQRMLVALQKLVAPIERFVPVDPEVDGAAEQYARIFQLMGHHMTTVFGTGGRSTALGILTVNWMMGHPVSRIISARRTWNKKRKIGESVGATIRKVFEDVEQIARFQAPRYLACYSDIARHELLRRNLPDESLKIPDLTLSLEFGVRGNVQLALMALGLSRSSTLAIADAVGALIDGHPNSSGGELDPRMVAAALKRVDVPSLNLPALMQVEVSQLIESFDQLGGDEPTPGREH